MAERQNPFSPSNSSVPPLISTPTSLPSTDPAPRAGSSAQAPQEQPMYATIAPKSQRKDHTSHPPSLSPPTMSLSTSSSVGPSGKLKLSRAPGVGGSGCSEICFKGSGEHFPAVFGQ